MPRSSGTYTAPASSWNPAVNGASATLADWNALLADLSSGLTQSVSKDGQTAMTGNLAMGSNKITGLAAGTTAGDSARYEQVTSAVAITGGTINGATIGATTPSTGAFTTLSATGASASDVVTVSNGGATPMPMYFYSGSNLSGISNAANLSGVYKLSFNLGGTTTTLGAGAGGTVALNVNGINIAAASSTGLAVTGALSATGTFSGGTSGTGYSLSGSAPANSLTLDASGNLLVGQTALGYATSNSYGYQKTNGYGLYSHITGTASGVPYNGFGYNGVEIGSITQSGTTAVLYNTTSDYRLKDVVGPVSGSGARLDALNPVEYTWKSDGTHTRGFLAHEFKTVYAQSVNGEKDAVDADGNPKYQSMQAGSSEVIADLVAEIKSLRQRLTAAGIA